MTHNKLSFIDTLQKLVTLVEIWTQREGTDMDNDADMGFYNVTIPFLCLGHNTRAVVSHFTYGGATKAAPMKGIYLVSFMYTRFGGNHIYMHQLRQK